MLMATHLPVFASQVTWREPPVVQDIRPAALRRSPGCFAAQPRQPSCLQVWCREPQSFNFKPVPRVCGCGPIGVCSISWRSASPNQGTLRRPSRAFAMKVPAQTMASRIRRCSLRTKLWSSSGKPKLGLDESRFAHRADVWLDAYAGRLERRAERAQAMRHWAWRHRLG